MSKEKLGEIDLIESLQGKGILAKLKGYGKLSGPGWLQAAVTLGGGSLASALYLGVVAGYSLLWIQPLAMLCGIVMLMALSHVTLGHEDLPFDAVKKTISPSLAWGWLTATIVADVVFCAAQSSLGVATLQQNLGLGGINQYILAFGLSLVAFVSAARYVKGSDAVKKFERVLKTLVAIVIVSFAAVSTFLLFNSRLDLAAIGAGLVPNPTALFRPADSLRALVEATGSAADYWRATITDIQRDRIIAAFGTAVGINMTFLLPYTLIRRGWGKAHRELSRYDLFLALLLPYSVATALLVVCAASSFHGQTEDVLDSAGRPVPSVEAGYYKILIPRLSLRADVPANERAARAMADALPEADRHLAAALTNRDAKQLATTLAPLMGARSSNLVFGIGVLAMALSTMMVHMVMNGFAVSQAVGKPGALKPFVAGAAMPALLAMLSPIVWTGDAKTALQIPAAVIATALLPIAYLAILLLMNSRRNLGRNERATPLVNGLMVLAAGIATFASFWLLSAKGAPGMIGMVGLGALAVVGVRGFVAKNRIEPS